MYCEKTEPRYSRHNSYFYAAGVDHNFVGLALCCAVALDVPAIHQLRIAPDSSVVMKTLERLPTVKRFSNVIQ
jgi:hypothetical protein